MKKIYILAAIALVAGVSCTKQVPADNNSPDVAIAFKPLTQKAGTKANYGEQTAIYSLANTSGKYESFKAWSVFSDAALTKPSEGVEFFSNITCNPNKSNSAPDYWELDTKYYWPKSGYLSFHAFSPSDVSGLAHTWGRGFILTDYTVSSNAAEQVDLLYSDYTYNKRHSTENNDFMASSGVIRYDDDDDSAGHVYDGVDIKFNHALASIVFKVRLNDNAYNTQGHHFTVKKVQIIYPYQTGTFYENRADAGILNAYADATTPDPTLTSTQEQIINTWAAADKNPYWAVTKTELAPSGTGTTYNEYTTNTYVAFDGSQEVTAYTDATAHEVKTNAILAMPQNLIHDGTAPNNHPVQVQVCYDYQYKSGTVYNLKTTVPLYVASLTPAPGGNDANESAISSINKWLINHKYIYTLNFKLDDIIFDPAVGDFVTVTVDAIDLPDMDS